MKRLSVIITFLALLFVIPSHVALALEADEDFFIYPFFMLPPPVIPEVRGCDLDETEEACCGSYGLAQEMCGDHRDVGECAANPCVTVEDPLCENGYGWVCECNFTCGPRY